MYYVYILKCADNSYYTGITTDLVRRLNEHNNGTASKCTRSRRPVHMVYSERCTNRSEASKRESAIKKYTHRQKELFVKSCNDSFVYKNRCHHD